MITLPFLTTTRARKVKLCYNIPWYISTTNPSFEFALVVKLCNYYVIIVTIRSIFVRNKFEIIYRKNFVGQNWRNFVLMTKILCHEFCLNVWNSIIILFMHITPPTIIISKMDTIFLTKFPYKCFCPNVWNSIILLFMPIAPSATIITYVSVGCHLWFRNF